MSKSSTFILIAIAAGAIALGACRREVPQPMGLGAADVPAAKEVVVK
jgi:hypothetical protein